MRIFGCLSNEKVEDEKAPKEETSSISYAQLYKFATPLDKFLIIFAIFCSIIGGASYGLFATTFGIGVGGIVTYVSDVTNITNETTLAEAESKLVESLNEFAVFTCVLGIIILISTYLSIFLLNYTALKQINKIRKLYLSSILNQDIAWHDQNQVGVFSSANRDDIRKLQEGIGEKFGIFISQLSITIVCLIQAFLKGWELALICSIPFPLSLMVIACIGWKTSKLAKHETELFEKANVVAKEAFGGIKTVVAFHGQEEEKKRYKKLIVSAMKNNIQKSYNDALINATTTFFMYGSCCLALWYGIKLVAEGRDSNTDGYTAGSVITIFKAITNASFQMTAFASLMDVFGTAQGAAAKIFHTISNRPKINKTSGKVKLKDVAGKITFDNVHFNYPSRKEINVLKGASWSINPGETVAIVGSSGCGKSTCVQLLQRFYDPDSGNIYIDDINVSNFDLVWLRNQIGVVAQEPVLFQATIAENIRFGFLEASQSDIEKAAIKSNAHEFIKACPRGYETVIEERGAQLSHDQKQRIALARALIRKPSILLLDEATSSFDSHNEPLVQAALDVAAKECTTIIVAHRLSTMRNVDKIIVMHEGRVVEEGSHNKLVSLKGAYYKLLNSNDSTNVENIDDLEDDEELRTIERVTLSKGENLLDDVEQMKVKNSFSVVRALLKVNCSEKWIIVLASIASIASGLSFPLYGFVFGDILSEMSEIDTERLMSESNSKTTNFILGGAIFSFIAFAQAHLWGIVGEKFVMKLRVSMFNSMLDQEMSWFDRSENGVASLGARLSGEIRSVQEGVGQKLAYLLLTGSLTLTLLLAGLYLQYKLFLVALICIVVLILSVYYEATVTRTERISYHQPLEEATKLAVEVISNIRTVASLGLENMFLTKYMDKVTLHVKNVQQNVHVRALAYGFSKSSTLLLYVVCFYYGAILLKNKETNSNIVFGLTELFMMTSFAIATTLAYSPNFKNGLMAAKRIFEFISTSSTAKSGSKTNFEGNILYRNIDFAYPTRPDVQILKNFDMLVVKNKTVALVGSSGCGKSTVIQLLQRFYDASSGDIFFGETHVTEANLPALRMRLGVVSQEPNLFCRTIGENIAYGDNTRNVKNEEIIEAAKKANIHNFIASLPLGYDTKLGEKGIQLFGGQKQKIAIARALVRNPQVLLLDEPTSSLDAENEKVVLEALDNAKEGRTCIVTAHRLKTVQKADVIMVINRGRIVEKGTHKELIKLKKFYWKLHKAQHQ